MHFLLTKNLFEIILNLSWCSVDHCNACRYRRLLTNWFNMSSSLFNDSGVSIPISDDDSDELGRMRVRVRRKRKKSLHRVNNELTRRVVRFFMKYWMVLVLVFAIGLLVFEATRIGRKPSMIVKTEQGKVTSQLKEFKRPIPDKKSDSTLNRLDPVMKIVHGVKERKCFFF